MNPLKRESTVYFYLSNCDRKTGVSRGDDGPRVGRQWISACGGRQDQVQRFSRSDEETENEVSRGRCQW